MGVKLNVGIIAQALPAVPEYVCTSPDRERALVDVRFLLPDVGLYSEDVLYFAEWETLQALKGALPGSVFCLGGGEKAAKFLEENSIDGIVAAAENPLKAFSAVQGVFLRYNQLENKLLTALLDRAPVREVLNCCADIFQNHVVLMDSERNLIDYSDHYLPGDDDIYWKETVETGRRSEKMLAEVRKNTDFPAPMKTAFSTLASLGQGLPRIMVRAFFDGGRRIATLTVVERHTPLTGSHLKLFDCICDILSSSLFHKQLTFPGSTESVRSVLSALLDKVPVDPLVVGRSLGLVGWNVKDDYRLMIVSMPAAKKDPGTLTRLLHEYERVFPDCIALKYLDSLVLIAHGDDETISSNMPKLERQLNLHNAICGVSLPFGDIFQIGSQYLYASAAVQYGDGKKRVRHLKDVLESYIIDRLSAEMPLIPLCHRGVVRIYEYDTQNGTQLLRTLEAYLRHNRSLKAAAEELFLHRSTMTYRLGCIEKVAELNLDDPHERLHVLLSCIVLRNLAQKPHPELKK